MRLVIGFLCGGAIFAIAAATVPPWAAKKQSEAALETSQKGSNNALQAGQGNTQNNYFQSSPPSSSATNVDLITSLRVLDAPRTGDGVVRLNYTFQNASPKPQRIDQIAMAFWEITDPRQLSRDWGWKLCSEQSIDDERHGLIDLGGTVHTESGISYRLSEPDTIEIDGKTLPPHSFEIDAGKSRSILATFHLAPTDWSTVKIVAVCAVIRILMPDGRDKRLIYPTIQAQRSPATDEHHIGVNDTPHRFTH